ncbi:MAG: protein kinase [Planctomycetes bacterium]|nr:protein kinase [Planctomycetota bacterium]
MTYHLVYLAGKRKGERIPIAEGVTTMGRSPTADVTVRDHKLSRIHCQIEFTSDGCIITDLNSTNGTFVNGTRISEQALQHGDHIGMGLTPLRVLQDPEPEELPNLPPMKFCDMCDGSVPGKEIMQGEATWVGEKLICGDCLAGGVLRRLRGAGKEEGEKRKDKKKAKKEAKPGELKEVGPYRIVEKIGDGELGPVHKAEQTAMHRTVALKILSEKATGDEKWLAAYLREANLAGQLVHPNILLIYDIDEADGVHYIAMEYVDGDSMHAILKKQKSLPIARAKSVLTQIAQAVEHAFEHKIPHRDIKPANILYDKNGTAKLGGFGTSVLLNTKPPKGIAAGERDLSNFIYCPPEFFRDGEDLDFRSDMYSLGACFYHMMTGRPPYEAADLKDLAPKVRAKGPKPPREIASGFPDSLCRIIEKAMAKEPDDRYQVPKELLWDLAEDQSY